MKSKNNNNYDHIKKFINQFLQVYPKQPWPEPVGRQGKRNQFWKSPVRINLLSASHLFCPYWCVIWNPEIYEKSAHSKYSMFPLFLQIFSKDSKYFPNIQCFYYFCKHFPMIPVFSKYLMFLLFFPGSCLLGRPKLTPPLFSCCPFLTFKF